MMASSTYLSALALAEGGRWTGTPQMQFTAVEEFPLDLFARLQADSGRQGQREADIEPGILSARTDRLHTQRVGRFHFPGL